MHLMPLNGAAREHGFACKLLMQKCIFLIVMNLFAVLATPLDTALKPI